MYFTGTFEIYKKKNLSFVSNILIPNISDIIVLSVINQRTNAQGWNYKLLMHNEDSNHDQSWNVTKAW